MVWIIKKMRNFLYGEVYSIELKKRKIKKKLKN